MVLWVEIGYALFLRLDGVSVRVERVGEGLEVVDEIFKLRPLKFS